MPGITDIINELDDRANVVIDIPIQDGEDQRLNCLLRKREAPQLALFFPPKALAELDLKEDTRCRLAIRHHDNTLNVVATITAQENDRTLLLTAMESVNPSSMREYFRVTIDLPLRASFTPKQGPGHPQAWTLEGRTVDLSGSGVLAMFKEKPRNRNGIELAFKLPERNNTILCQANIARTYRLRKHRFQVAFHFEQIDQKDRDLIIACCLQEQRRQLREKVRID